MRYVLIGCPAVLRSYPNTVCSLEPIRAERNRRTPVEPKYVKLLVSLAAAMVRRKRADGNVDGRREAETWTGTEKY